jgi:hypothetical protein
MHPIMMKSRVGSAARSFGVALLAVVAASCADKEYRPVTGPHSTQMVLSLTVAGIKEASQLASVSPRFLVLVAGFEKIDTDFGAPPGATTIDGPLGLRNISLTGVSGTQTFTLPVDLAPCLAHEDHTGGKDSCNLVVAVALRADSAFIAPGDTSDFVLAEGASDVVWRGPYEVASGRLPVLESWDLSASRFGAVTWQGDNALRLGGGHTPTGNSVGVLGLTGPITGAFVGSGPVSLFMLTQGTQGFPQQNGGTFVQGPFPQLAIFENGSWRRISPTDLNPGSSTFTDVTAVSPTEAYVGHRSGLYRFDGAALTKITTITDSIFSVGHMSNATTKLVIAGSTNVAFIGNGTTFTRYVLPVNQRFDGACITGPNEAFVSSSLGGAILRFDGTTWTSVPAPSTAGKLDLQCPAPGLAYVTANNVGFFRWGGGAAGGWTQLPGLPAFVPRRPRMSAVSSGEIYAFGDSAGVDRAFYRFDGSNWTEVARLRFAQNAGRPWADPRGGAAYVGSISYGRVERVTATSATAISYMPSMRDVFVNSATSAFAVGNSRFLSRWDGVKWTVDAPPAGKRTVLAFNGVWSDGPNRAWVVGQHSSILNWNGSNWSVVTDSLNPGGPLGEYFAVWGSGTTAFAAGDQGVSQCTVGVGCTLAGNLGGPLYGVWGSAVNNVWAVGANGRIMRNTGSGWTSFASPTNRKLVKIAGSGPSDIWAVGDSVLLHFNGTAWSTFPMIEDLLSMRSSVPNVQFGQSSIGLWVRNSREAYLGSDFGKMARWDGERWHELTSTPDRRRIVAISMGANGCGLAVTDAESTPPAPAPTLWRGLSPSGCFASPMTAPTSWP